MSAHKIAGHCTLCDAPCFEVLEHDDTGAPKRLGHSLPEATRIEFLLYDGTKTALTFCGECAGLASLESHFVEIWAKVMRSWIWELEDKRPEWFMKQFNNGLLCEIGRKSWKVLNG